MMLRKAANRARSLIVQSVAQHQWAQVLTGGQATEAIARQVHDMVDDWCGTTPFRPWPFPWPTPVGGRSPVELLLAGVQFQRPADALFGAALGRLEDGASRPSGTPSADVAAFAG